MGSVALLVALAAVPLAPVGAAAATFAVVGVLLAPLFPIVVATTAARVGRAGSGRVSGWQLVAANGSALVFVGATGTVVSLWGGSVIIGLLIGLAAVTIPLAGLAGRMISGPPVEPIPPSGADGLMLPARRPPSS